MWNWTQQVSIGLIVWQNTILPQAIGQINKFRYRWFILHSKGGSQSAHWGWLSLHWSHMTQGTTLIQVYSCNIQKDPKATLLEDWIITQSQEPVIREIKYLLSKNKLKGCKVYLQDPQIMKHNLRHCSHLVLCKGVLYRQVMPSKEDRNTLHLVIPQSYQRKFYKDEMMTLGIWD